MQLKETQKALNTFAKYVIQQSRTNLTKGKKNASKELYNSLDSDVKVSKNSFQLSFLMEEYGVFQDKGVSGKKRNTIHLLNILIKNLLQVHLVNGL